MPTHTHTHTHTNYSKHTGGGSEQGRHKRGSIAHERFPQKQCVAAILDRPRPSAGVIHPHMHTHPPTYADRYTHARVHERARTHRGKHTDMFIHLQIYICTALALGQSPQGRRGSEGGGGRGRCGRGLRWRRSGRPSQHLTNAQTDVTPGNGQCACV